MTRGEERSRLRATFGKVFKRPILSDQMFQFKSFPPPLAIKKKKNRPGIERKEPLILKKQKPN